MSQRTAPSHTPRSSLATTLLRAAMVVGGVLAASTALSAQSLSLRPEIMEVEEEVSVAEFARSLQVYTGDGDQTAAVCMVTLYNSQGEAWASFTSGEMVTVEEIVPARCWSGEMAEQLTEMIPNGRFGPSDRLLSPGLIVNADFLTAHEIPVTVDHPIDPFLLSDELRFSTPRFESALEDVGRPMESPYGMESDIEWVALSFLMIPMSEERDEDDSGGPLSREFETRPVTVLLGARER